MSATILQGYLGDEDKSHREVFSESLTKEQFIKKHIPKSGSTITIALRDNPYAEWVSLTNNGGKLFIEFGESAA